VSWVWFQVVGFQLAAVALWQLRQFCEVGMWLADLAGAVLPLWQLAQLVALV
jgi:hypothetical protein